MADVTSQGVLSAVARKSVGSDSPGTTNLVSWYDITESSGTISTISDDYSTNDLTTSGSPSGGTTGKWGTTIDWNGSTHYASSTSTSFDITGAITLGAWINLGTTSDEKIFTKYTYNLNQRGYTFAIQSDKVVLYCSPNGYNPLTGVTGATTISSSTWTFVVGVFNPSTEMLVYVNGVEDASNTTSIPASIFNSNADLLLGSANGGIDGWIDGLVQSAFIYDRVLTADEITWLYNSGSGRQYADL